MDPNNGQRLPTNIIIHIMDLALDGAFQEFSCNHTVDYFENDAPQMGSLYEVAVDMGQHGRTLMLRQQERFLNARNGALAQMEWLEEGNELEDPEDEDPMMTAMGTLVYMVNGLRFLESSWKNRQMMHMQLKIKRLRAELADKELTLDEVFGHPA